jgi:hypothetical protein
MVEAPPRRLLRKLPGRERDRGLSVLAAGEALLLGGGGHGAVDDERGGGIVEHRVDAEHLHIEPPEPVGRWDL